MLTLCSKEYPLHNTQRSVLWQSRTCSNKLWICNTKWRVTGVFCSLGCSPVGCGKLYSCESYLNPLLCYTKPHVSWCSSLARSASPKGFPVEGCRQEHLVQVHTTHLQALSHNQPLCGQLYSTHWHPHLDLTWILCVCHVQPQNAGQTTLISMHEWDTPVGSEGVLEVPRPSSSGYRQNIWWEKREKPHSKSRTSYALHPYLFRKHSFQYASRTTHASPRPPKAGLPALLQASLGHTHVLHQHPCQLCFYQLSHSPQHGGARGHRDTVTCFPVWLILTCTTNPEKPGTPLVHMPSTILCTIRERSV